MSDSKALTPKPAILPRAVSPLFETALDTMRVVVVTGARQTGKSTLVKTDPLMAGRPYFTLDDPATLLRVRSDRQAFLRSEPEMVIDEIQRDPELMLAIKVAVDEQQPGRTRKGQFVVTGSANLLMMDQVADSLSGRAYYLRLQPLTRREQLGLGSTGIWTRFFDTNVQDWLDMVRTEGVESVPQEDWQSAVKRGGFPAAAVDTQNERQRSIWFDSYIATYLERDLRDLQAVSSLQDFQALMQAASLRIGNLLNHADLARDVRMSQSTVHNYMNLMETSYQAVRLKPYARNRTTRLIKTPKLYWNDVGLALHLSGSGPPSGAHLENYVLTDLMAWRDTETPRPEITYWRTAAGAEVDFVIEWKNTLLAIEVKSSSLPSPRDAANIKTFCEEYGEQARGGVILNDGAFPKY